MSGGYVNPTQVQQQSDEQHLEQVANMAIQKQMARQSQDPRVRAMDPIIPMPAELQQEFNNGNNSQQQQAPQLPQ